MAENSRVGGLLDANLFGAPKSVAQVVAGSGVGSGSSDVVAQLAQQLQQLQTVSQAETESLAQNTQAVAQNTAQIGQGGGSTAGKTASAIESTFGLGLGLSPLITGLIGLFGGGGGNSSEQVAPVRFALPPPVHVEAGVSESVPAAAFGANFAEGGQARASAAPAAQITVQVQALDSQSFLDHSNDIAMAVRQAMLESSVLNDVVREV